MTRDLLGWLEEALAEEEVPPGIPDRIWQGLERNQDRRFDLHSLWSGLTGLTQEVKLQSRAFHKLQSTLGSIGELAPEVRELAGQNRILQDQQLLQAERRGEQRAVSEQLDLLLDMRDRLLRGVAATARGRELLERTSRSLRLRIGPGRALGEALEMVEALHHGYILSLERLEGNLARMEVREVPVQGQKFDPLWMKVLDIEETDSIPEGTVTQVYRSGYERRGEPCRAAEVQVARPPRSPQKGATA
ncbi:MAG: nucleotide exchange factor GrpE [Armatimonadetes bacterium]|nr:nucleotide exchange factor GrpE [Armatimonadota bacterium]